MTELEFFYRDDDPSERIRVGKIIAKGGCKPVLWETLEEMKDNWHDGFVGGATDDRLASKGGMITSGARDIAKLSKGFQLECRLALLTNVSNIEQLKELYGHGPNGIFQEYFDKEDALLPQPGQTVSAFENFVRECSLSKSTEKEKFEALQVRLNEVGLNTQPPESLILENEVTFQLGEQELLQSWKTLGEIKWDVIKDMDADSRTKYLDRMGKLIKDSLHTE